jgi:hypothetical protein
MHVRLEYCLVRLFVGRPFLLHRSSQPRADASPESETNCTTTNKKPTSRRLELVNDCVSAAQEALDICQLLRDNTPGLARASYIEYSSCRASLLVLIACSIQDDTCQFHDLLQRGLDMICEMSAAGDSARSEVSLIESLERALQLLDLQTSNGTTDRRYGLFKTWESMWQMNNTNASSSSQSNYIDSAFPPAQFEQTLPTADNMQAAEMETFGPVYSAVDLDLFSERHINLAAPGSESQLLEDLLRDSGFDFNHPL